MRFAVVCALGLTICNAQTTDWKALVDGLTSEDAAIKAAHDQILLSTVAAMRTGDAIAWKNDMDALGELLRAPSHSSRTQASKLLPLLASSRPDSAAVMASVFPVLLGLARDEDPTVRWHALRTVLNLQPQPSAGIVEHLKRFAQDKSPAVSTAALASLVRLVPESLDALQAVLGDLASDAVRQRAVIHAAGSYRVESPDLLAQFRTLLRTKGHELTADLLQAVGALGPAAKPLRSEIEALAASGDHAMETAAKAALASMEGAPQSQRQGVERVTKELLWIDPPTPPSGVRSLYGPDTVDLEFADWPGYHVTVTSANLLAMLRSNGKKRVTAAFDVTRSPAGDVLEYSIVAVGDHILEHIPHRSGGRYYSGPPGQWRFGPSPFSNRFIPRR